MRRNMTDKDWLSFENFEEKEFKCKCVSKKLNYCNGYHTGIAWSLVWTMQQVRNHFKKSITISSGLRCSKYNDKIGGSKGSNHIEGLACDFYFSGMNKQEVIKYLKTLPYYQYAYTNETNMKGAVHITVKPTNEVVPNAVKRDNTREQVEVLITSLNVRYSPNGEVVGHAKKGFYNVLQIVHNKDYDWCKIDDNRYIALKEGSWTELYPIIREEDTAEKSAVSAENSAVKEENAQQNENTVLNEIPKVEESPINDKNILNEDELDYEDRKDANNPLFYLIDLLIEFIKKLFCKK